MEVGQAQPLTGERIQRRGGDLTPERPDVRVAQVVGDDEDDVGAGVGSAGVA